MIMQGLVDEGMDCIEAVRQRYDGERRNPWNEFECGNNYARSMAAYALLNAFSGFEFDMVHGMIGFTPIRGLSPMLPGSTSSPASGEESDENVHFRCFWSLDAGWGEYVQTADRCELRVLSGELELNELRLGSLADRAAISVRTGDAVAFTQEANALRFSAPVRLTPAQGLHVQLS